MFVADFGLRVKYKDENHDLRSDRRERSNQASGDSSPADHTKVFVVVPEAKAEPFSVVTGEDGLPIIRTANGVITSQLVKDIEAQLA